MEIELLLEVKDCRLVHNSRWLERMCLPLQSKSILLTRLDSEGEHAMILQNVGKYISFDMHNIPEDFFN
jgi:hypothetical protein